MSISRESGADSIAWCLALTQIGLFGLRPEGMFARRLLAHRRFARSLFCLWFLLPVGALPVGALPVSARVLERQE